MSDVYGFELNPELDLVLERVVPVPRALVWKGWTRPEYLEKWFVPRPWSIASCTIDLRPGGEFRTVMKSPEGQLVDNAGCYLEIVDGERLSWTSALAPGFRPVQAIENGPGLALTATILLETIGDQTRYRAIAAHGAAAAKKAHEEMGFADGWGTCLDQLVEAIETKQIV